MPIQMVVKARRYYHKDHRREYVSGQQFAVDTEEEAARMERRGNVKRAPTAAAAQADFPRPDPPLGALDPDLLDPETQEDPIEAVADEAAALRAEYQDMVGKRPFMGWDAETLRQKIADLKERVPEPEAGQIGQGK